MSPGCGVLVLLEDGEVREDSLRFALELCRRLGSPLAVLALFDADCGLGPGEEQALIDRVQQALGDRDVPLETTIRRGDKLSEVLKFLAGRPRLRTVVWGGDAALLAPRPARRSKNHWLSRIRNQIDCPIVTAARRRNGARGAARRPGSSEAKD